jgi:hypothetical protein
MRRAFDLNTSLYLMLIAFVVYFGFEKVDELKSKRRTLSMERDSVHTDAQNFVSPLIGADITGKAAQVDFKNQPKPTIVYVFSPVCHYCELNEANFATVFEGAKDTHRFIGVATFTIGLPEYLAEKKMTFQVLTHVKKGDWKLALTPQMVVVSADGRLMRNWMGLQDGRKWEAEQYFGFTLPGARTPPSNYTVEAQ